MSRVLDTKRFLEPRFLASHFHIEPGSTVMDYGAGTGTYLPYLAKKVGASGRVIACEAQRPLVDKMSNLVRQNDYQNVEVVWCDVATKKGTRMPDEVADFAVVINTLYQVDDLTEVVQEIARTLRQYGIVYVVDWNDSFGGVGPTVDRVRSREAMIDLFETNYFLFERDYPAGDYHYGVSFRKL